MQLLFDKTTRRIIGTISGPLQGISSSMIPLTALMPAEPETAYLSEDNVTISTKALTAIEQAARSVEGVVTAPVQVYTRYEYADFVDALTDSGAARKIIIAKKTDAGADLEVFMEVARARGYVDFNNEVTRGRLNGLVPHMLSQDEADKVTGE